MDSTLQKNREMINPFTGLEEEIDIHQRRCRLQDPTDLQVRAISTIIIYSSFYYPHTKPTLLKAILALSKQHIGPLSAAITHLYGCLEREIITGPSSSFFPPAELPERHHEDLLLIIQPQYETRVEELEQGLNELGLAGFFEKEELKELVWYNCERLLSMKGVQQHREGYRLYQLELELEGESWLQTTPFPTLFLTLNHLLQNLIQQGLPHVYDIPLRRLWARLSFLHNRNLKNPVKSLSQIVLPNYKRVLQAITAGGSKEDYIELLVQFSFCLLFYYKYSQTEAILRHCCKLLRMKIQFSGRLGRRTKYQQFDTPQLIMAIHDQEEEKELPKEEDEEVQGQELKGVQFLDAKQLVAKEKGEEFNPNAGQIKSSTYDEESILLETPKFTDQPSEIAPQKVVNEHHLLVTLAILHYQWRSIPHDEMLYQNISASIATLQSYKIPTSFSYNYSLLLLRSLNEFPRIKHAERALDQLEKLRMVFNNKAGKYTPTLYSTPYETHLSYVLLLADRYMEIGLSLSAMQLFGQAGLHEECVDVLIQKSYKERALEMIDKLIEEKGENPRILCMLGDLHKDPKYYYQAWELSNHRSSRAMRALGWHYYNLSDYAKAAECFHNATVVSYYHPSTWFTLGCCYMRDNHFDKALRAFSECVSIDDTQGQAWGNMASCYMHQKKMKEAYSTLQQAVKYSQGNWKLWSNLISVSLVVKKFYKYFEAIERIAKLGHQEVLNEEILKKVVQIMQFKNQSDDRRRIIFNFRNRINRLYDNLEQTIGQNPLVWRGRTLFQIQILEYIQVMSVHYHNLHVTHKIDPNDVIPGYETLADTQITTEREIRETKAKIVHYKQTELNMTMRIGWHENKVESERVKSVLLEYVDIYRQYSDRKDKEDFRLFISGVAQKISFCLQENFTVPFNWLGA